MSSSLTLNWCSYEAARFACEHWHYSKCMPAGKNVFIGVWENNNYIGCIIFGMGSGNATNGTRFGLSRTHEMAELCRIALTRHDNTVSRIVSIAIKMLHKQSPGLRLLTSMADPRQDHIGVIYQAGNWIYTGKTNGDYLYQNKKGEYVHHRSAGSERSLAGVPKIAIPGKHRYLMPLDDAMKKQIEPLRKPYPKKSCAGSETVTRPPIQAGEGGPIPTPALIVKQETINAV